ncbi:hypothetical protein [Pedobacter zeae]|uniref:Uncharacterized protein n=1 Tax=Pedobacter zeae TaxID=1737356 RepID=A0A7W6K9R4_9SPHI|nr:hypothetical protein [Pedobacter zeae]MBB4106637.1 hypothetical protein [Pedobacter zeae]GGH02875.1 hypothetical protein GCM10007422_17570 [Pedobacter zeae]
MAKGRFAMSANVEAFCKQMPLQDFLRFKWPKPAYPEPLIQLFPIFLVYYREKPGKPRKLKDGYNAEKLENGKIKWTPRLKQHKKRKTTDQNNFSVYVHYVPAIGDLGTVARIVKHKGHGKMVAAYQPTDKEVEQRKNYFRLSHIKYKNFNQLYLRRKIYDPLFKDLTDRLEAEYKCNSTGQTVLF